MSTEDTTPAAVGSNDQLGMEPERAKYHARGLGWALASALGTPGKNWTADDVANAYADGALEAVAEERALWQSSAIRWISMVRNGDVDRAMGSMAALVGPNSNSTSPPDA